MHTLHVHVHVHVRVHVHAHVEASNEIHITFDLFFTVVLYTLTIIDYFFSLLTAISA